MFLKARRERDVALLVSVVFISLFFLVSFSLGCFDDIVIRDDSTGDN